MKYPAWTGTYHLRPNGNIRRRRLLFRQNVPLFEFHNCEADPLTLHLSAGEWIQPFRRFDGFDFGSVPLILQGIVSPLAADKAFALHDSCYEFHAYWTPVGLVRIDRREADNMLYIGMRAQGCGWWTSQKAWIAVRVGGAGLWRANHDTLANLQRDTNANTNPDGT